MSTPPHPHAELSPEEPVLDLCLGQAGPEPDNLGDSSLRTQLRGRTGSLRIPGFPGKSVLTELGVHTCTVLHLNQHREGHQDFQAPFNSNNV